MENYYANVEYDDPHSGGNDRCVACFPYTSTELGWIKQARSANDIGQADALLDLANADPYVRAYARRLVEKNAQAREYNRKFDELMAREWDGEL